MLPPIPALDATLLYIHILIFVKTITLFPSSQLSLQVAPLSEIIMHANF